MGTSANILSYLTGQQNAMPMQIQQQPNIAPMPNPDTGAISQRIQEWLGAKQAMPPNSVQDILSQRFQPDMSDIGHAAVQSFVNHQPITGEQVMMQRGIQNTDLMSRIAALGTQQTEQLKNLGEASYFSGGGQVGMRPESVFNAQTKQFEYHTPQEIRANPNLKPPTDPEAVQAEASAKGALAAKQQTQDVINKHAQITSAIEKLKNIVQGVPDTGISGLPALRPFEAALPNIGMSSFQPLQSAQNQIQQLTSSTILPAIKEFLQGTGQVRVFEGKLLEDLNKVSLGNTNSTNLDLLNNFQTLIDQEKEAALQKFNTATGGAAAQPQTPSLTSYGDHQNNAQSISKEEAIAELRRRGKL